MRDRIIILACDTPDPRVESVAFASRLARRAAARLVFHCVLAFDPTDGEAGLNACFTLVDGDAQARFFALRPTLPGVPWLHHFEIGRPEQRIPALQRALSAEVVVLEDADRTWVDRVLGTSLAERLRGRLGCPLAVVGRGGTRRSVLRPHVADLMHPIEASDMLNATVDARLEALVDWLDHRAAVAAQLARSPTVALAIAQRERDGDGPWRALSPADRVDRSLRFALDDRCAALGALGWQIRRAGRPPVGRTLALGDSAERRAFVARVERDRASCSLPLALEDGAGSLVIVAGARLAEVPDAVLLLWFDARDDFLRILGQPGAVPTFETYAFDASGLMLSNSRFPDHLHARGLLPTTDAQTPLRMRVCEPGAAPRAEWPLTRMAAAAIASQNGDDIGGYLDYRGTEVIGAWRWIDRYGFGMTAEIDKAAVR